MNRILKNKVIVVLMLLVTIFTAMVAVLPAYAASTTVTVDDVSVEPGEEVKVDVIISGNTGFCNGKFKLDYDSSVLTLTKIDTKGKILSGATVNLAKGMVSYAKATNITKDGVLFTAIFEVKEDAPNKVCVISVKVEDMTNIESEEEVNPVTKKGSITVHKCRDAQFVEEVPATCSKEGTKAYYLCSCGKKYSDKDCTKLMTSISIAKKSHTYASWETTKDPTCTTKGEKKRTCKDCGYIITPAKNHTHKLTKVAKKAATCTAPGNVEYYTCNGCADVFADSEGKTKVTNTVIAPSVLYTHMTLRPLGGASSTMIICSRNSFWT